MPIKLITARHEPTESEISAQQRSQTSACQRLMFANRSNPHEHKVLKLTVEMTTAFLTMLAPFAVHLRIVMAKVETAADVRSGRLIDNTSDHSDHERDHTH